MSDALSYTPRERKFVMWSAILGYAFDFYNLIVVAFLLVPIQKSLNVTLTQTGVIVGMTLASSVLGGVLFGWLGDKIGRKNALLVDAAPARHRLDAIGGGLGFRLAAGVPHHHRHRRRRRMGRRHGAAERGLGQHKARPRQRHRAGDVVGRHGDGLDRGDAGADLFRCRHRLARRARRRRHAASADAVRAIEDAGIAAVAGVQAPRERRRSAEGEARAIDAAGRDLQGRLAALRHRRRHHHRRLHHRLPVHQHLHADADPARPRWQPAGAARHHAVVRRDLRGRHDRRGLSQRRLGPAELDRRLHADRHRRADRDPRRQRREVSRRTT